MRLDFFQQGIQLVSWYSDRQSLFCSLAVAIGRFVGNKAFGGIDLTFEKSVGFIDILTFEVDVALTDDFSLSELRFR